MKLHRHQLLRLSDAGWRSVCSRSWDEAERGCLNHWASHGLPLVVTRQACGAGAADTIAAGLAAPLRWQRRRIALAVDRGHVSGFDEFPHIHRLAPALPPHGREAWPGLCAALAAIAARAHVYGSHGWQLLSGLAYVHARSDIDLWTAVADVRHADAAAEVLAGFAADGVLRLDGELVFGGGRAVAWREWRAWRAGRCRAILTKTLAGAELVDDPAAECFQPATETAA